MAVDKQKDDLDALVGALSGSFEVSESYSAPLDHPRYAQFKNYGQEKQRQQKRRSDWLQRQKDGRDAKFEKRRSTSEHQSEQIDTNTVKTEDVQMSEATMNWENHPVFNNASSSIDQGSKPGSWKNAMNRERVRRIRQDLKGRLMYSEWLIDVPEDFATKWIMIPAPNAKRTIITMDKSECKLYNKAGQELNSFTLSARIPSPVVFDGFVRDSRIYILDFISCGPYELESCDFDCRRSIGKSFLEEKRILTNIHGARGWTFTLLEPTPDCSKQTMEDFMSEPAPYELDGLMFYYREGFYTSGVTPLVTWLKPWMLPDILDVKINPIYMEDGKQTTPKQFMEDFAKRNPTYSKIPL